jgi:hypothetical protein
MQTMRADLDQFLKHEMEGVESRRKTIDVLVGIWHKTALIDQSLHSQALEFLLRVPVNERIWLHYGLTLLAYPFFRQTVAVIGQFAKTGEPVTRSAIKNRLAAEIGHLGSLNRASERIVASLGDWGILSHLSETHIYNPKIQSLNTPINDLQTWLLTCALIAHPSNEITIDDLLRLPELFPFKLTVTIDHLRSNSRLTTQRQGSWEMVKVS